MGYGMSRMPIQELLLRVTVYAVAFAALTWLAITSLP
jgi:hypothetical protein